MAGGHFIVHTREGGNYPGKLTWYVVITCIMAAMGGFIFGYDIGISGGVTSMDSFLKCFFMSVYHEQALNTSTNQYCKFDSQLLTLFTSSLYLAALIASIGASFVSKKHGRKLTMFLGGLFFLIGAVLNAAAIHISMLILGRFLLGLGVGFANQSVPIYLSEIAPYKYRGAFNVLFQLAITLGILTANIVNFLTNKIPGGWGWRVSLGGAAVPALVIMVSSMFLSDSPSSLIDRGNTEEAEQLLKKIRGVDNVKAEFKDLVEASEASKKVKGPWKNLMTVRKYRPQLTLSALIPTFQQLTGINVVMFYAPVLFKTLGFKANASLMSAVITGAVNVGATFISVYCTDRYGRRVLFLWGGVLMCVFQALVAGLIGWKFGITGVTTDLPQTYAILVVLCICVFVAAFAFSWGPLGWLVPSEISPLEVRSAAQCVTVSMNMLLTFGVAQVFLKMLCCMKFGLFIFFAAFVFIMTLFVYFYVPETKNIPIEEMSQVWREHWYWKKFVDDEDAEIKPRVKPATDIV
ncbi:Sugar transport protein 1 [Capsicum annuum]|uniref:Sugar transport protein 1 n=1 Tax=Capsicum annuum TaxID=4072 RepID=A0A1U8FBP9_CAPAN|nr:sugar carrier protein C-like isoform X1 [Capsicum annuum]KAF3618552.1 Sugar transport protein 1 [Capsicum annuum]PHT84049.1 Sugar transport protein 1 [Capsicum annuum]